MSASGGDQGKLPTRLARQLAARRAAARTAILIEQVWPAVWPALGLTGVFACAALLGLAELLPPWAHIALVAAWLTGVLALLARGLAGVAIPDAPAADRRLELQSGLTHRPLAMLADRPSGNDPVAAALWRAHVARMAANIRRLRVGLPRPGLAKRDPRAWRSAILIALLACLGIAGADAPSLLARALLPSWPRAARPPGIELQAWITPPAYTGLAPVFLKRPLFPQNTGFPRNIGGAVSVPAGARLTVNVTGDESPPSLAIDQTPIPWQPLDKTSFQAERDLTGGGRLTVRRDDGELAGWDLSIIADQPPVVAWSDKPGASARGPRLRLPWRAEDDYGVVALEAELLLQARPELPPVKFALTLPSGDRARVHQGIGIQDLSAHPWAGLAVRGRLIARDAVGQTGESPAAEFILPEREFHNPVARALIALRRGLTLHPEEREDTLAGLDALLLAPRTFSGDLAGFLNLAGIYYALVREHAPMIVAEVQQRMWQLAIRLEEGQADRSARALDQAREAARDAMDRAERQPIPERLAELDRRLKELEEAIQRHIDAIIEQASRDGTVERFDPEGLRMDGRDLEKLAEAAREAARDGRTKDAQDRLAELEKLLDRLREAKAGASPNSERRAGQRQRGKQQMNAVQDMIARQGGLLDHAQGREQGRAPDHAQAAKPGQAMPAPEGAHPDQPAEASTQRQNDRRVQQALRRALGELMQQFGDLTGAVPGGLSDADKAMEEAARALAEGSDSGAGSAGQRAIEALQKGGREMGQAMAQQFGLGRGRPGDEAGEGDEPGGNRPGQAPGGRDDPNGLGGGGGASGQGDGRDPLGRQQGQGNAGANESADVRVPDERERLRAQAIQEELRRRGADRSRGQEELDYIERLLKRF